MEILLAKAVQRAARARCQSGRNRARMTRRRHGAWGGSAPACRRHRRRLMRRQRLWAQTRFWSQRMTSEIYESIGKKLSDAVAELASFLLPSNVCPDRPPHLPLQVHRLPQEEKQLGNLLLFEGIRRWREKMKGKRGKGMKKTWQFGPKSL
uniref:Uncharacterized protein n=1 Tax=Oryza sativa subsp. japonica TaxID=39947 RepID=Q69X60_ORYSJ|nr:hypothetical protein [Oryza sativa Japonica Group]